MDQIRKLTNQEFAFQRDSLNLIASDNFPSPAALALLGSIWDTKYAEGYGDRRYYAGNKLSAELEKEVSRLALLAFSAEGYGVNLQVLSGSLANAMVYLSVLEPGDLVLSPVLSSGGHLSHFHESSSWLKFFKHASYGVKQVGTGFVINMHEFQSQLESQKPKLVIIGFSAYPASFEFEQLITLAHQAGALVLADISHIAGLVATGLHSSPFAPTQSGADFVSTTTHKTLRGPRGALLFAQDKYMEKLNKTVFPGTLGGPHLHQIAAIGQSLAEVVGEREYPDRRSFVEYVQAVTDNAQALEKGLSDGGLQIVTPTQTHLTLVRLPGSIDSLELQRKLEALSLITNRNMIPDDTKTAWRPSGLRLGTAALTSRGLLVVQAELLGRLIASVVLERVTDDKAKAQVAALVSTLAWHYSLQP